MDNNEKVTKVLQKVTQAFQSVERTNSETHWRNICEVILPSQADHFNAEKTPGQRRTDRILDSVPPQACYDLAAYLHATLTNPASVWGRLEFNNPDLNDSTEACEWLDKCNRIIFEEFDNSNLQTSLGKCYQQYSGLGNMVLFEEEKLRKSAKVWNGLRFQAWHLGEIAFSENYDGVVDAIYKKFDLTVGQIVDRWGVEGLPEKYKDNWETKSEDRVNFVFAIYTREDYDPKYNEKDATSAKNRPVASCIICMDDKRLIEEDGYYEFPVYVGRWSTMPGETYGRGPGHMAYPDVQSLYKVKELSLTAIAKAIAPPMIASERTILSSSLSLKPNGVTVVRHGTSPDQIRELNTNARFDVSQVQVQDMREQIKQTFFLDKLMLPPRTETGEMTAYEVSERLAQTQKVLGPTINRLMTEFLAPLMLRTFKILFRAGRFPEQPQILRQYGINIDPRFVNQLTRSQQMEDVNNISTWAQQVGMLAQLDPSVLDVIDTDEVARYIAKARSIPEMVIRSQEEIDQIRKQRQQQQQMAQALEAGVSVADMQSKMGQ